jgi:hypothetical protein
MNAHAMRVEATLNQSPGEGRQSSGAPRAAILAGLAALVAVAVQCLWIPIDADVSWLITVAERVLSGDRLYVDIVEVNPPASVWLYLPLVWLAQLIGTRPEAVVAAAFVAAGLASVWTTVRLASKLENAPHASFLAGVVSFIVLVLPMALFAQREHAALLLAFPALTVLAMIAEDKHLRRRTLHAAGFAAGLVIVIKPYFLFPIIAPAVWVAIKRRSLVPLLPSVAAAAIAIGFYAVALLVFAPAYLDYLPVIARTYAPMHDELWKVAVGPTLYPAICLGLGLLLRGARTPPLAVVWALGAAGFLLAAYVQAKNYPNHWLPSGALALAATAVMLASPRIATARRAAVGIGLSVVALSEMYLWAITADPAVAAIVREVAPPRPKIIALSPQLTTGHPVTRNVGGRWVGSRAGLFTAAGARSVGLGDPVVLQAYREDSNSFATDVERHRPDVVLVNKPTKSWLMNEPVIARAMSAYRLEAGTDDTEIWLRRNATR